MKLSEEDKKLLRKEIKFSKPKSEYGGQNVGYMSREVIIISDSLNVQISMGFSRSQFKNRELAMKLFNHLLEIIE